MQVSDLSGGQGQNRTADTRIFSPLSAGSGGLIINHLQRLPALSPATKAHSWHTQSELVTFLAQTLRSSPHNCLVRTLYG